MEVSSRSIRTQVVAITLMMVIAVICVGAFAQPAMAMAMAMANGHDCVGPGCGDQLACGQPSQPQASSGPSQQLSLVALPVIARVAAVEGDGTAVTRSPPLPRPSQPFGPSAPRSPPSA
jgi:hypothetical protein